MKKKILIVDDEEDQINSIKLAMETIHEGFKIDGVTDGFKCLEFLKKEKPDLILLDLMMPGMNGWQVHDAILRNPKWKSIPVLFLTGVSDPLMKATGQLVAEDYIEKPVEVAELKKRIDKYLN